MLIASVIIIVLTYLGLVMLAGFRPAPPELSSFELQRRLKQNNSQAVRLQARLSHIDDVMVLVRLMRLVLVIALIGFAVTGFGWWIGIAVAVVALMSHEMLARVRLLTKLTHRVHDLLESQLFNFATEQTSYLKPFRGLSFWADQPAKLASRQELLHSLEQASFLTEDEQLQLKAALKLDDGQAKSVMTPIKEVMTISQNDLLGPLLLHELSETGVDTFPVTHSATNKTIVGTITISQLLTLEDKTSHKAKRYMHSQFPRLSPSTSIADCIGELVGEHAFMAVIYDENKALGVVRLSDCLNYAFGRQL